MLYSLIHHIACRFEARQALIYQLASGLTGENGKYNYSKAVHLYPPFFDIFCSPKNYKTASALTVSHGENESSIMISQGTGTTADMYEYIEGTPPQSAGEAALTRLSADKLRADIGDTITIKTIDSDKKFIITAIFQSMNYMGEGVRLHEDEEINYIQTQSALFTQIKFTDDPDQKETARRMEKIQKLYPELDDVSNRAESISNLLKVVDTIDTVKQMVVVLTFILAALITVLMERSFIVKEQGEIALMKAIGMRDGKIYAYHILRFVFVGCMTVIAAELFALPLTHLFIDPIFKIMGSELALDYVISPFEMFFVFPLVILAATTASAFFTSLYTKTITALDTARRCLKIGNVPNGEGSFRQAKPI